MSIRNFILKQKWLQKQQPLIKKALLLVSYAMLSSDLYAQRWRGEYNDITPTPWWLSMFIVIAFLFYSWMRKSKRLKLIKVEQDAQLRTVFVQIMKCFLLDIKDNPKYSIAIITGLAFYTMMLLYEWDFCVFIAVLILGAIYGIIKINWEDWKSQNK